VKKKPPSRAYLQKQGNGKKNSRASQKPELRKQKGGQKHKGETTFNKKLSFLRRPGRKKIVVKSRGSGNFMVGEYTYPERSATGAWIRKTADPLGEKV